MKKKILVVLFVLIASIVTLYLAFPGVVFNLLVQIDRSSAGFTEKSTFIDNHTIPYLEGGEGENILLLHGFASNKDLWNKFSSHLTKKYHVVSIDVPGFGDSSRIAIKNYSIFSQAKRVYHFVNKLKLKKFHIAGSSMGGAIAGKFTVDYPDKILSLCFFDTAGIYSGEKSEYYNTLINEKRNLLVARTPEEFDTRMKFVFVNPPEIPDGLKGHMVMLVNKYSAFDKKIFKESFINKEDRYFLEKDLPEIKTRTLIIWGDTDRIVHKGKVKILEKGLANSRSIVIKECGHLPMLEKSEETAVHYLEFLAGK